MAYGATDAHGMTPSIDACTPDDVAATIFHCLGIDPEMTVNDRSGRPFPVAHGGEPIRELT